MGWRLFAIVACYCDCTEALRPYLFKYLETTASDTGRTYSGAASICLQNLRKTFKYGGRKNVPLHEEISALAVSWSTTKSVNWCCKIYNHDSDQFDMINLQNGRISKRFAFIFSGCEKEGMVQIKPCTVCTLYMLVSSTLSTLFSLNIASQTCKMMKYMIFQLFTFQVVRDAVEEICARLNISDSVEIEEYTLFLRTSTYWSWILTKKAVWSVTSDIYHF